MKYIKRFENYTDSGFNEFIKNILNSRNPLSNEEYNKILYSNKEILHKFYNKYKNTLSIISYINSEIKNLLLNFSVSDLVEEFSKENSLKSILDKYDESLKKDQLEYIDKSFLNKGIYVPKY